MKSASTVRVLPLVALLLSGCHGVSWPSDRIVRSLRVLAVQAQPASVTPGQSSQLSLLLVDDIESPDDNIRGADAGINPDIDVAWFGACNNPPHNDPSKCLRQYASWLDQVSSVLKDHSLSSAWAQFQVSQTFQFHAPQNVLQNEATIAGEAIQYGISYVYFAACAGKLVPATGLTDQLPVQCRDRSSNALLDQSRFVVGVTTIYAYDKVLNHNPLFPVPKNCFGQSLAQCASQPPQYASAIPYTGRICSVDAECDSGSACASDGVCAPLIQACNKNTPGSCNPHDIELEVAVSSFLLTGLDGTLIRNPLKSLWVDCYSNSGTWPHDPHHGLENPFVNNVPIGNLGGLGDLQTRLNSLTEATSCGSPWQAPSQATDQARVWAVVRDDRGGIGWLEKRFVAR